MITAIEIQEMLVKFGVVAILKSYPSAVFDQDTNRTTLGTMTQVSVRAVPPYQNREGYTKPDLISSGRGLSGISASAATPKVGMKLTINGEDWSIVGMTPVGTSAGIVYYQLEIEK